MDPEIITLVAGHEHFEVHRDILTKSSLYFRAAFQSGMSESISHQFMFSNLTAHQLVMVVRFLHLKRPIWDEYQAIQSFTADSTFSCADHYKLMEVLELIDAADYLQMCELTEICINRITSLLNRLFKTPSVEQHRLHDCNIFSAFLLEFTKIIRCNNNPLRKLFSDYALCYPQLIFKPSIYELDLLPQVISLTLFYLSGNVICVSSEDIVFSIVESWLIALNSTPFLTDSVVGHFLHCIRPALLSMQNRMNFLNIWNATYPTFKWHNSVSYTKMKTYLDQILTNGTYFTSHTLTREMELSLWMPRADSVCLICLIQNRSNHSFEFCMFNLHNGSYHIFPIPTPCLNELGLPYAGSLSPDHIIYFCPFSKSTDPNQSSIFVLCFNQNTRVLSGFTWCLATCQAKSVPRLFLHSSEKILGYVTSTGFHSRRISLATLSTGLHLFYVTSLPKATWLCLFHFDVRSWSWLELEPYSIYENQDSMLLFTPIEQLNSNPPNDWLYANIEMASQFCPHVSRHQRHGLHRMSDLRSHFFRFRPCCGGKKIEVENLPTAPFLIRIYRLMTISVMHDKNYTDQTYLFPIGTCSRDTEATHYCLDTKFCQWLHWSPYESVAQFPPYPADTNLRINLCPKILGFRGLVCATHLLSYIDESCSMPDPLCLVDSIQNYKSDPINSDTLFDLQRNITTNRSVGESLPTSLVLIGKPDESRQVSSGIWFHRPMPYSGQTIDLFDPKQPKFTLPTAVTQALGQFPTPATVVLANWMHITQTSNPVQVSVDETKLDGTSSHLTNSDNVSDSTTDLRPSDRSITSEWFSCDSD